MATKEDYERIAQQRCDSISWWNNLAIAHQIRLTEQLNLPKNKQGLVTNDGILIAYRKAPAITANDWRK